MRYGNRKAIDLVNKGYEFWKLLLQAVTAFAAVFAAGGVERILSDHG